MNSAEELSKYKDNIDCYSPTLSRRLLGYGYDFPEKTPKKEKKWSIGNLFRRKKKEESESSSDEETKKGFLGRRKKKSEKKKKKPAGTFDHVVISRNSHLYSNGFNAYEEPGIFSDPATNYNRAEIKPVPSNDSLNDPHKKSKKVLAKVRAEARRHVKHESSSDEESQVSASSAKFRSDESLQVYRDTPTNRRSRAARTERYMKRHSKDGENPADYLRLSKSDAEQWKNSDDSRSLSRSPLVLKPRTNPANLSGLSTIPPSHGSFRYKVTNSTNNPSYKPPLSMNDYNNRKSSDLDTLRSLSCEANIDKEVTHGHLPIHNHRYRNLSLIDSRLVSSARQPPPPPPRDPRRLVTAQFYDNCRPNTYYLDGSAQKSQSFNFPINTPPQSKKFSSFNLNSGCRSTSEDHLPKSQVQLIPRPSSATPESSRYTCQYPAMRSTAENCNYFSDKKPRSRRPIFIRSNDKIDDVATSKKAVEFWKQKDKAEVKSQNKPQMFTSQTTVQTQVFLPSVLHSDINKEKMNCSDSLVTKEITFKNEIDKDEDLKRKSSNLEEALDELEAIYNSLRLGDEDLLERAEQREKDVAAKKMKEKLEVYPSWNMSRGALSDSSFSYEPFDSVDSPRRKRLMKKSQTVDRRADDMAFRKLNKERAATITDPQSVLSKVCYLNASPVFNSADVPSNSKGTVKEPDVTFDDVVYRNVKFANSTPKVVEPQPPFGIPLGPITPASNSDYLHAKPDNVQRSLFKPRKIPDLVKDDLAFRNLRKDDNKVPQLSPEDLKNNNTSESKLDLNSLKKKRAVRSLSANISTLVHRASKNNNSETLTDIADAMEIARQVLKDKENKINATKRGFLSDSENGNESVAESRLNFLNSLRAPYYLDSKPPRGLTPERRSPRSPKESTPIPVSPFEEKIKSRNSSLDDLLTAFAVEARETHERISNDLLGTDSVNQTLTDIETVSEQAKKCEKWLEGVIDSTVLIPEEVEQIKTEPEEESVANVVVTREDSNKDTKTDKVVESDHDYENLISDEDLEEKECISPFEEHKAELIATFQDLRNNVEADFAPASEGEQCVSVACLPNCARSTNETSLDSLDSLESLKSPRLVLETSRMQREDSSRGELGKADVWYCDPATVAVACSYGIACAHQLASLDFVAVLGVLFAVLSFIAALLF